MQRYTYGLIPGLNDRLAYGYYRAAGHGWSIEYSEDAIENGLTRLCRRGLRKVLGFDLIHLWRNRQGLLSADVVWTHTELEHLAALFMFLIRGRRWRPTIIANCVWLFDRWPKLSRSRRFAYRALLKHADVVTTFSPANLEVARRVLPDVRSECILWGIATEKLRQPQTASMHNPIRIASLGSDVHRDWQSLIEAFSNRERYELRIGSGRIDAELVAGMRNVAILTVATAADVMALYEWADIVVISLKPNLHASGITVILESVIRAISVVCTDTGGLRAYFSPAEIDYVPAYAPEAMRAAVDDLARDEMRRATMIARAQERVLSADLTANGFAARHRRLSEELLQCRSEFATNRAVAVGSA